MTEDDVLAENMGESFMKKTVRFLCFLFAALLLVPNMLHAEDTVPSVSASSAVLIEAGSGKIIYGKNENQRRGMASTTKIMTAIVALENASLDKLVTVAPGSRRRGRLFGLSVCRRGNRDGNASVCADAAKRE